MLAGGTDNGVYREKIKHMWGRYPLDVYGITEGIMIATQTWDYDTMTFFPQLNLLEFMPEKEWNSYLMDKTYQAELLLLDEVKAGENYALVITNFRGGAFVRYFIGDVVKITSLRNDKLNINLPQMVFESRIDGIIDIAGFTRLTEKVIWQALENSGVLYQDWAIKKEATENKPVLHLYIEPKQGTELDENQITDVTHKHISLLDNDYALLESILNLKPLKVTLLPQGTFQAYIAKQQAAGADLAHLKPPHVNPTEDQISALLTQVL
jgi:phenylacetate-coenzyme A ligase PaaK-like adenylate-forming protein